MDIEQAIADMRAVRCAPSRLWAKAAEAADAVLAWCRRGGFVPAGEDRRALIDEARGIRAFVDQG